MAKDYTPEVNHQVQLTKNYGGHTTNETGVVIEELNTRSGGVKVRFGSDEFYVSAAFLKRA